MISTRKKTQHLAHAGKLSPLLPETPNQVSAALAISFQALRGRLRVLCDKNALRLSAKDAKGLDAHLSAMSDLIKRIQQHIRPVSLSLGEDLGGSSSEDAE